MSEIKVNSIKGVGASAAAITVNNTDGTCTANITNNLSNRNKVINGSAIVSQRGSNTVVGVADGGFFCADRFKHVINAIGGYTIHHEADAPSGFSHSHKVQTTTADTSLDAGSVYMIRYIFEGQDVQDFAKGTSDAKQYSLSFFVKTTNFTGTFVVELIDSVNTRHCCKSYTVSSAGSWQKVELIFPADTTGAITSDNAGRFEMNFYIGAGSGYTAGTLQTAWGGRSGNTNRATGQTAQIGSSTSNRFQITGVQLEVGSVATDFEHRSFAQELALCQRYFFKTGDVGTSDEWYAGVATHADHGNFTVSGLPGITDRAAPSLRFPVYMRVSGTVNYYPGRTDVTNTVSRINEYTNNNNETYQYAPQASCGGLEYYFQGISGGGSEAFVFQCTVDAEL